MTQHKSGLDHRCRNIRLLIKKGENVEVEEEPNLIYERLVNRHDGLTEVDVRHLSGDDWQDLATLCRLGYVYTQINNIVRFPSVPSSN